MSDLPGVTWNGVKAVNLMRGAISITDEEGNIVLTVPPSGQRAWVRYPLDRIGRHVRLGIPLYVQGKPVITGVPEPEDGVIYLVSTPVLMAYFELGEFRPDVFSPGRIVREGDRVIGCIGLRSLNAQV